MEGMRKDLREYLERRNRAARRAEAAGLRVWRGWAWRLAGSGVWVPDHDLDDDLEKEG